jgi:2-oxoisovalerate dehydrogenase E1 component
MTYREAVKQAIRDAMIRDERVFLMGEDVGAYGGCYAVTKGLMDEFGEDRIRDTPCRSRASPAPASVRRRRDAAHRRADDGQLLSLLALDQIMNTAATIRHMSGGQFGVPLVIRMATGAGKQLAAQHSHSLEGWYAHIPGLKVLAPATVEDARGMLWTALQDPDPVLIFENVMLYNRTGADRHECRGRSTSPRRGPARGHGHQPDHLWRIAAQDAGGRRGAGAEGISAEVIDLRTCARSMTRPSWPRSQDPRAVIVDEGLAQRLALGRDLRPDHGTGASGRWTPRWAGSARRGADPLSQASGRRRDPAGSQDRRRGQIADGAGLWACSRCPRSGPTWRPGSSSNGWSSPGTR